MSLQHDDELAQPVLSSPAYVVSPSSERLVQSTSSNNQHDDLFASGSGSGAGSIPASPSIGRGFTRLPSTPSLYGGSASDKGDGVEHIFASSNWKLEAKTLLRLAFPVVVTYMFELTPNLISIAFIGRSGSAEILDASALGTMFSNVFGLSVLFGMCFFAIAAVVFPPPVCFVLLLLQFTVMHTLSLIVSCLSHRFVTLFTLFLCIATIYSMTHQPGLLTSLDTLCAQAFGYNNAKMMGIYLQRATYMLLIAAVPIFFLNYYAAEILKGIGQPHHISDLAGRYVRLLMLSFPGMCAYEMIKKVLQAQSIVTPMLVVAIIGNFLHAGACYIFIFPLDMGLDGAALARLVSTGSFVVMTLAYIKYKNLDKVFWTGFSKQGTRGLWAMITLSLPGMIQVCR
jgi:Na+-driven multidrug efflux pump